MKATRNRIVGSGWKGRLWPAVLQAGELEAGAACVWRAAWRVRSEEWAIGLISAACASRTDGRKMCFRRLKHHRPPVQDGKILPDYSCNTRWRRREEATHGFGAVSIGIRSPRGWPDWPAVGSCARHSNQHMLVATRWSGVRPILCPVFSVVARLSTESVVWTINPPLVLKPFGCSFGDVLLLLLLLLEKMMVSAVECDWGEKKHAHVRCRWVQHAWGWWYWWWWWWATGTAQGRAYWRQEFPTYVVELVVNSWWARAGLIQRDIAHRFSVCDGVRDGQIWHASVWDDVATRPHREVNCAPCFHSRIVHTWVQVYKCAAWECWMARGGYLSRSARNLRFVTEVSG